MIELYLSLLFTFAGIVAIASAILNSIFSEKLNKIHEKLNKMSDK